MGFRNQKASNKGDDFEPAPEGPHNAVCVRLVDMGMQDSKRGPRRRVQIGFEIDEPRDDGERFMVASHITLSLHKKANLRQLLEGWRGRAYQDDEDVDITGVVGRPALINIVHNESGDTIYANIASVSPLPKGMEPLKPSRGTICLSLDPDEYSDAEFEKLSENMQDRIRSTPEWVELTNPGTNLKPVAQEAVADFDDGIPF